MLRKRALKKNPDAEEIKGCYQYQVELGSWLEMVKWMMMTNGKGVKESWRRMQSSWSIPLFFAINIQGGYESGYTNKGIYLKVFKLVTNDEDKLRQIYNNSFLNPGHWWEIWVCQKEEKKITFKYVEFVKGNEDGNGHQEEEMKKKEKKNIVRKSVFSFSSI